MDRLAHALLVALDGRVGAVGIVDPERGLRLVLPLGRGFAQVGEGEERGEALE